VALLAATAAAGSGGTVLVPAPGGAAAAAGIGDGATFTREGSKEVVVVLGWCVVLLTTAAARREGGIVDGSSALGADGSMVAALAWCFVAGGTKGRETIIPLLNGRLIGGQCGRPGTLDEVFKRLCKNNKIIR
jgi:hypothetical protein